jgi:hypothetical protein
MTPRPLSLTRGPGWLRALLAPNLGVARRTRLGPSLAQSPLRAVCRAVCRAERRRPRIHRLTVAQRVFIALSRTRGLLRRQRRSPSRTTHVRARRLAWRQRRHPQRHVQTQSGRDLRRSAGRKFLVQPQHEHAPRERRQHPALPGSLRNQPFPSQLQAQAPAPRERKRSRRSQARQQQPICITEPFDPCGCRQPARIHRHTPLLHPSARASPMARADPPCTFLSAHVILQSRREQRIREPRRARRLGISKLGCILGFILGCILGCIDQCALCLKRSPSTHAPTQRPKFRAICRL